MNMQTDSQGETGNAPDARHLNKETPAWFEPSRAASLSPATALKKPAKPSAHVDFRFKPALQDPLTLIENY
jgi:hypothetical protein